MLQRNSLRDRLFKRGKIWWVWGYDFQGERYWESTGQTDCSASGGPGKAALEAAKAIESRRAVPAARGSDSPRVDDALKEAILSAERADRAENTIKTYVRRGKHLRAGYGGATLLDAIELKDSNAYMDRRLEQGASRHTIHQEIALLIQVCHEQKELGRYGRDPSKLMPKALRSPKDFYPPPDTWLDTQEQIDALLRHLAAARDPLMHGGWACGPKRLFVRAQGLDVPPLEMVRRATAAGLSMTRRQAIEAVCAERRAARRPRRKTSYVSRVLHVIAYIHSGMRDSELDAIRPEDVNLATRSLHIRGTKTDGSRRDIQMSPTLTAVMKEKMKGRTRGEPLFEPWPSAIREMNRAWTAARTEALAGAKAEKRVLRGQWPEHITHNLFRRTFCSLMFNAGVPAEVCAKLLGHSSLEMVLRIYGKLSRATLQDAVDRLPALQLPNTGGTVTVLVTPPLPKRRRSGAG